MRLSGMIKAFFNRQRKEKLHHLSLFDNVLFDEVELRDWTIFSNSDNEVARKCFPDFDVAYTRAIEDTRRISERDMQLLEEALPKCVRKSLILSYMFMYYRKRGNSLRTFEYAVRTTLAMCRPGLVFRGISVELSDALHLVETVFRLSSDEETAKMVEKKFFSQHLKLNSENKQEIYQLAEAIRSQKDFYDIMFPARFKLKEVFASDGVY